MPTPIDENGSKPVFFTEAAQQRGQVYPTAPAPERELLRREPVQIARAVLTAIELLSLINEKFNALLAAKTPQEKKDMGALYSDIEHTLEYLTNSKDAVLYAVTALDMATIPRKIPDVVTAADTAQKLDYLQEVFGTLKKEAPKPAEQVFDDLSDENKLRIATNILITAINEGRAFLNELHQQYELKSKQPAPRYKKYP